MIEAPRPQTSEDSDTKTYKVLTSTPVGDFYLEPVLYSSCTWFVYENHFRDYSERGHSTSKNQDFSRTTDLSSPN